MTDKEFRRLGRADLVEIIYQLQKSEGSLQDEIAELEQKLEDRRVAIEESGSLAEVLAKLDGLFKAAQSTADDYREEAGRLLEEARQTRQQADEYLAEARQQAEELIDLTMRQRKETLTRTEEECRQLRMAARSGPQRENDCGPDDVPRLVKEDQFHGGSEG